MLAGPRLQQRPRPGHGSLWPIFLFTALQAGLSGLDSPTRNAVTPELVGTDLITAAAALNQILYQVGGVAGPTIAGLVIAQFGLSAAFWLEVFTYGAALLLLVRLRALPPPQGARRAGVASVLEGLRFLGGGGPCRARSSWTSTRWCSACRGRCSPELAATVFGGGARTVGLLHAAPGAGALLGAVASGWTSRVRYPGRAVLWAVAVWGVAIAGFAATSSLPLAVALLAVAGAGDVVSAVFRGTILQTTPVPERLRGRLDRKAVHISVVAGGPRLGDAESGAVGRGGRASVLRHLRRCRLRGRGGGAGPLAAAVLVVDRGGGPGRGGPARGSQQQSSRGSLRRRDRAGSPASACGRTDTNSAVVRSWGDRHRQTAQACMHLRRYPMS